MMLTSLQPMTEDMLLAEERQAALGYINEAFLEARLDGLDGDCMAQAALFFALKEFVLTYGEDSVAKLANGLPERIRNGEFSVQRTRQ